MKNIYLKTLVLCGMLWTQNTFSQDIHFSQFDEAPLLRNPALAGLFNGDVRLQGVYRNQWNSITVPYRTGSFNAEYKLPIGKGDDFITLDGQIIYDKAGTIAMTSTSVLPGLNYHKSLSDERNMYLSVGFNGGLVQRKFDRSKVTTNNEFNGNNYDPTLGDGETFSKTGYSYLDGSAGISFQSQVGKSEDNNLFIGIAYHHFNKATKISFYGDQNIEMIPKWVVSGGLRSSLTDYSYITFHGDYSKQGTSIEMIGGLLYSYKLDDTEDPKYIISGGVLARLKDALIPVVKLECKPLTISMSYDVNISSLKAASQSRGGFELSLSYVTSRRRDNYSVRCPRF